MNYILNLFDYSSTSLLLVGDFNLGLVVLSLVIATFSSFMAFQVAQQATTTLSSFRKQASLLVGSLTLGGGVWSMHFIGMLAFELCTDVSYNWELTLLSLVPSIAASWVALNVLILPKMSLSQLIIGGVLMGLGIGTMHYLGMAAMEMAPLLRYDITIFSISIGVAVVLAILSLWTKFGLRNTFLASKHSMFTDIISSLIMGLAIYGMHYTGMAAARFVMPEGIETSSQTSDISLYLALTISIITVFIISIVLAINVVFRYKDISAASKLNEQKLLATMDTAIDGIVTINEAGVIESVNKAVESLLGWTPEEIIGKNVKVLVPDSIKPQHDNFIKQYLRTKDANIIGQGRDVEALTKDGELIPIRLGIGHAEFNGKHLFVGFISDLRDRVKMESALVASEAKLRSLMSNIPGIVYRAKCEDDWPHIFMSEEVENIVGYPYKDFILPNIKRNLSDFIHPEDLERIADTDLTAPGGFNLEFRLIDRYGTTKWMLGHGRISKNNINGEEFIDGFIMDISDRKEMEVALLNEKVKAEQAVATRSAFLANMSHEIRTPMNAIIGFSDILLETNLNDDQNKHLKTINQSAKSLLHILNDILDSAKLEKGKFQLEYRDFSLIEEIDAVVSTLWLQANNKGVPIKLDIAPNINGIFNGVPDRLRQVLTNLLGNAVKFTSVGEILITVKQLDAQKFTFCIKDTGIGMSPKQLKSVFDAFSQADESMSRRFGGTGLGTTISKQLVELMGGEIRVESEIDVGTTFCFDIPLTKVTHNENLAETKPKVVSLPPLTVLVVDDIEQNIELLNIVLKRDGHTTFNARDGEQALERMKRQKFDLVLMDIQMPVLDGLSASKARRAFEKDNGIERVPIIALTASVLPEDKLSAEQAGMEGFANKPIDIIQLKNEMARVLKLGHSAVAETSKDLSSNDSINVEKGVALWGSKAALYKEIQLFSQATLNEFKQLQVMPQNGSWEQFLQKAHSLKGLSGNLALTSLANLMTALEKSAMSQSAQQADTLLKKIHIELEKVCKIVKVSTNKPDASKSHDASPTLNLNSSEVLELLTTIEEQASRNEFNEESLDALTALNLQQQDEVMSIAEAFNNFDFEEAQSLIKALKASADEENNEQNKA
ncbi:MHYT domain-containing protein [Paraglaciecola sp. 2405UD69-4]|uniref:MHYT domain-containing protein n=1 Tax=Paraglaciecola sp. 2405UD69-4 TaxID=3391836 RepID=UPI0039C94E7F